MWRRISSGAARSADASGMYRWKIVSSVISAKVERALGWRRRFFEKKLISCARQSQWSAGPAACTSAQDATHRLAEAAVNLAADNVELRAAAAIGEISG